MIILFTIVYVITGIGFVMGYHKREATVLDLWDIVLWPCPFIALVTVALKKYVEEE